MSADLRKLMPSMKGNLILMTINLVGITHIEVHYTATLHAVLLCSTIPVSRVTSVAKTGMTGNFKACKRDLGVKLCEATLSIKIDISSPPIIPYKFSNPT